MTLTLICGSALLSADADLLAYNNNLSYCNLQSRKEGKK